MDLQPLDKLIIHASGGNMPARVIGVRTTGTAVTYYVEPLRLDFTPYKQGRRILRITAADIAAKRIHLEKH